MGEEKNKFPANFSHFLRVHYAISREKKAVFVSSICPTPFLGVSAPLDVEYVTLPIELAHVLVITFESGPRQLAQECSRPILKRRPFPFFLDSSADLQQSMTEFSHRAW